MRVTESRLLELGTAGVSDARDRLGRAQQAVSSGTRVDRPSQDPTAWAQAARADASRQLGSSRGRALGRASDQLVQTDDALAIIGDSFSHLQEMVLQGVNGTLTASERQGLVEVARSLGVSATGAGNVQGLDGEFLLAGTSGASPAFDAAAAYSGDANERELDVGGGSLKVGTSGAGLGGVLPLFEQVAGALAANDVTALRGLLGGVQQAISDVSATRSTVGSRLAALGDADVVREAFEQRLLEAHARAVDADPIAAASELARTASALEAARASAEAVLAVVRTR